jgi:pilus assembly protein Flp/PilA
MGDFHEFITSRILDERGVTAIEYGLIAGLIAVAIIGVLTALSGDLANVFNTISNAMS